MSLKIERHLDVTGLSSAKSILILLAAATSLSVYDAYRIYHHPSVFRQRRQIANLAGASSLSRTLSSGSAGRSQTLPGPSSLSRRLSSGSAGRSQTLPAPSSLSRRLSSGSASRSQTLPASSSLSRTLSPPSLMPPASCRRTSTASYALILTKSLPACSRSPKSLPWTSSSFSLSRFGSRPLVPACTNPIQL